MNYSLGKIFIVLGMVLIALGFLFLVKPSLPWLGRLPGDIMVKKDNFSFYFPITTSILASIIFSLLIYLFRR